MKDVGRIVSLEQQGKSALPGAAPIFFAAIAFATISKQLKAVS